MTIVMKNLILLLICICSAQAVDWHEVLGPPRGDVPYRLAPVVWRHDITSALKEAQSESKPLFVTMRCLPCKQCSAFDKEVLEGGAKLDPLLSQFVTVRITNAAEIDLRMFPVEKFQDLDLSWWGWFLSPEGKTYGVFGGRDEISDATRISKEALIATLKRVLQHHYDPRRASWKIDGPTPEITGDPQTVRQLPGYSSWYGKLHPAEKVSGACIHCHQVNDILRTPAVDTKTFDKIRDVEVWPLPENVGIALDRDDGLLVKSVVPNSPAARAGVQTNDRLGAANGRRLFSQADFRGVLHRGPRDVGNIDLVWLHGNEVKQGQLKLPPNWRKTDLGWRMSISQGVFGGSPGFFPLNVNVSRRQQLGLGANAMAIEPYMGKSTSSVAYRAGVRGKDVVTSVDGISTNLSGRAFLVWFKQRYEPGDRVKLTVRDAQGRTKEIAYELSKSE
jgi:hypothetical protein